MGVEATHRGDEEADLEAAPPRPNTPSETPRPRKSTRRVMGHEELVAEHEIDPADAEFDPDLDGDPRESTPSRGGSVSGAGGRRTRTPPAAAFDHPPYLVRMARDIGMDEGEIGEYSTDALAAHVRAAQQFLLRERAARARDAGQLDARRPREESGPPGPVKEKPPENPLGFTDEPADDNPALTKDGYDRKLVQALNTLWKRNQELEEKLTGTVEHVRQREAQTNHEKLDDAFAAVADLYPHLGSGPGAELGADSDEMARRVAVIHAAGLDFNKPLPSAARLAARIKAAAARLFGKPPAPADGSGGSEEPGPGKPRRPADPYAEAAAANPPTAVRPKKPAGVRVDYAEPADEYDEDEARRRAWMEAGSPMPTHRKSPQEPKGVRRAAKAVANLLRAEGYNGEVPESDEEADLP